MNKKVIISVVAIIVIIAVIAIVVVSQNSNKGANEAAPETSSVAEENQDKGFKVSYLGVDVTPGVAFDRNSISEEGTYSELPSCAFEGTDNVSTYSHVEITSSQMNGVETVYSVYFIDDGISTEEGVKITDDRAKVLETYGDDYTEAGNKITYTKGKVELSFIIENDIVTSIEYVYVVE